MNTTGIVSQGPQIEGMAVWRVENRYYLWVSPNCNASIRALY